MKPIASDIAFSPSVKLAQAVRGSREQYQKIEKGEGWSQQISPELKNFIAARDSFYLGTSSLEGQPYIQHRGGPNGFLKVLDDQTLAFADFAGNRQFITIGNLAENHKAFIFLMDYEKNTRIKIWGTAEVIENDSILLQSVLDPAYRARPERVIRFHVKAWDVNCRQHIPRLLPESVGKKGDKELAHRIAALEAENKILRQQLSRQLVNQFPTGESLRS